MDVERNRPQRRIAGLFKHHRLGDVGKAQAAERCRGMGRQQSSLAGAGDEFVA